MIQKIKEQSLYYARNAAGVPQTIDLRTDFGLKDAIVAAIQVIIRGNMVSTGGGAISGFARDEPAGRITQMKLRGAFVPKGGAREILSAPPQQMFYPGNFSAGLFHALLLTSSGASSTDPFRATIPLPLVDPNSTHAPHTYLDIRDYTSLNLVVQWDADTTLATTNLSSISGVELEVKVIVVEDGPHRGTPHYEPNIVYKELPLATSSTRLVTDGNLTWDGDLWAAWFQTFDASASGNSQRVDGSLREVVLRQGKRDVMPRARWDALRRATWEKYNPSLTTTEVVGVVGVPMSPRLRSEDGDLMFERDTATTNPLGISAITPAAGDTLMTTLVAAEPVHGAD